MFDKFYIGQDVVSFEKNGTHRPVSKVTLKIDSKNSVSAGDDSGFEISANCPYATQVMADRILAAANGFEYKMYNATAANLDPAAELGDGADICGLYSVIASISDDGFGYPDVSAPGESELEYKYPYESYTKRKLDNLQAEIEELTTELEDLKEQLENVVLDGVTGVIKFNGRDGVVVLKREDCLPFIVEEIDKSIYATWSDKY